MVIAFEENQKYILAQVIRSKLYKTVNQTIVIILASQFFYYTCIALVVKL